MRSRQPFGAPNKQMARPPRRYWLRETEPADFSFADLLAAPGRTADWNGVRNHQSRNLRCDELRPGDGVLIYHSGVEVKGVVGLAEVAGGPAADPTPFERGHEHFAARSRHEAPTWVQVPVRAVRALARAVELAELERNPKLVRMGVVQRGNRLWVQPVSRADWLEVLRMAGEKPPA